MREKKTRRQGDKKTKRQEDKETRRLGYQETQTIHIVFMQLVNCQPIGRLIKH